MTKREQIRAVLPAIGLAEGLLAIFAAVADELAAGACVRQGQRRGGTRSDAAVGVMDAEVDEDGVAGASGQKGHYLSRGM